MNRAAVLGKPIAHSLSPVLHTAGYAACGLRDWTYGAYEVGTEELAGFVEGLDETWRGLSLTMPLKEVAFEVATSVSAVAVEASAINTLVRRDDGGWDGHNTDVVGLARAIGPVDHGGSATILGAGATARSAVLAMRSLGVREVAVAARRPEAIDALAEWAGALSAGAMTVTALPLDRWAEASSRLVVSTLPPAASEAAATVLAQSDAIHAGATFFDVVYAGWPTLLARAATDHGMVVRSGLDMLIEQAAEQFLLFTGVPGPVEAMAAAVADRR